MMILDLLSLGPLVSSLILHAGNFAGYQIFPRLIGGAAHVVVFLPRLLIQILAVALVKLHLGY